MCANDKSHVSNCLSLGIWVPMLATRRNACRNGMLVAMACLSQWHACRNGKHWDTYSHMTSIGTHIPQPTPTTSLSGRHLFAMLRTPKPQTPTPNPQPKPINPQPYTYTYTYTRRHAGPVLRVCVRVYVCVCMRNLACVRLLAKQLCVLLH